MRIPRSVEWESRHEIMHGIVTLYVLCTYVARAVR